MVKKICAVIFVIAFILILSVPAFATFVAPDFTVNNGYTFVLYYKSNSHYEYYSGVGAFYYTDRFVICGTNGTQRIDCRSLLSPYSAWSGGGYWYSGVVTITLSDDIVLVWSSHDIYTSNNKAEVFYEASGYSWINYTGFENPVYEEPTEEPTTEPDDDGGLLSGISNLIDSVSDFFSNLFTRLGNWFDSVTSSISNGFSSLYNNILDLGQDLSTWFSEQKQKLIDVKNSIVDLPNKIGDKLSYYFNPSHPDLPGGSFGEVIQDNLSTKFDFINQFKSALENFKKVGHALSISNDVTVGSMTIPVNIDFSWYNSHRVEIRSGIACIFYVLTLLADLRIVTGIFGINLGHGSSVSVGAGGQAVVKTRNAINNQHKSGGS